MFKQGQLCYHYRDMISKIYHKYGNKIEFTYRDLTLLINDYNMSIHRKFIADDILVKQSKRPHSDGIWRLTLSRDVILYE